MNDSKEKNKQDDSSVSSPNKVLNSQNMNDPDFMKFFQMFNLSQQLINQDKQVG